MLEKKIKIKYNPWRFSVGNCVILNRSYIFDWEHFLRMNLASNVVNLLRDIILRLTSGAFL